MLVDRAFDIGRCDLDGASLCWQANPGVVGPWYYEPQGWGWFRSWGGGMVVTCGLDHTLGPGEDTAVHFNQPHLRMTESYGLHGRMGGLPARLVGYGERWVGDECVLWAEGEVLQSMVYGEHLLLRRRIEARVGETRFRIRDVVENVGHTPVSHMLLYHCNAGFPVVDAGAELLVPARATTTDYAVSIEGYRTLSGPIRNATEACFEHDVIAEADGVVPVAVVNRRRGIGVYQVFNRNQLPSTRSGGCSARTRTAWPWSPAPTATPAAGTRAKRGELGELAPGEARTYDLEIGGLRGSDEIDRFADRVAALGPAPA